MAHQEQELEEVICLEPSQAPDSKPSASKLRPIASPVQKEIEPVPMDKGLGGWQKRGPQSGPQQDAANDVGQANLFPSSKESTY
jgi:hypothetical protein